MKKVWEKIRNIFNKFFDSFKFYVENHIEPAIKIVEQIKNIVNSPILPFITAAIPGTFDDVLVEKVKEILPRALALLQIGECIKTTSTNDEVFQCVIAKLKGLNPDAQNAFYLNLAAMISTDLSDGHLTWSEAVILVQYTYNEKFKKP
jgi:hypothetical protein